MIQTLRFFTVLSVLLIAQSSVAQVFVGFRAGVNISYTQLILEERFIQSSNLTEIEFSLPVEWQINDFLSLQTGIHHEKEGATVIYLRDETGPRTNYNTINYLGIPTLVKLRLTLDDYAIFGLLGAYTRYGLSLKSNIEGNSRRSVTLHFSENDLRRWDAGGLLGLGIEKTINNGAKIVCNLRYLVGMTDICTLPDDSLYNSSYALSMGISIPLRHSDESAETLRSPFRLVRF